MPLDSRGVNTMGNNLSPDARRELITKKAYELFVKRGSKPGHEMDDWLEAEKLVDRELTSQQSTHAPARQGRTPTNRSTPAPTPIRTTTSASSSSKVGGYKRASG